MQDTCINSRIQEWEKKREKDRQKGFRASVVAIRGGVLETCRRGLKMARNVC